MKCGNDNTGYSPKLPTTAAFHTILPATLARATAQLRNPR